MVSAAQRRKLLRFGPAGTRGRKIYPSEISNQISCNRDYPENRNDGAAVLISTVMSLRLSAQILETRI